MANRNLVLRFKVFRAHLSCQQRRRLLILDEPSTPAISSSAESKLPSSKKRRYRPRYWYVDNTKAQKTKFGVRQTRRTDSLNQLISMAESLNDGECDLEILNLLEPASSPLTKLFFEEEKMKIWNDFINRSEEQQVLLLNGMSWDSDDDDDVDDESAAEWEKVEKPAADKREVHPGFSAEKCFKRIDSGLRAMLSKRHLPKGTLACLEEEITGFFKLCPSSIFVSQLPSSYERLLMHALCQYLDLRSKSFDDDRGVRRTQVENKNDVFVPPIQSLTEYLESRH